MIIYYVLDARSEKEGILIVKDLSSANVMSLIDLCKSDKLVKILRLQQTTSHLTVNVIMLVFTLPKQLFHYTCKHH